MKINAIISLLLLSGLTAKCQDATAISNSHPATNTSAMSPKDFASPGCVEFGGSVSYTSATTDDYYPSNGSHNLSPAATTLLFAPYFGYFPVQGLELGVNPLSIVSQNNSGVNTTSLLFIFAPSYNFKTPSKIYPFIEGNIGYNSNSGTEFTTESGICYGGRIGFKFALAPHALLNFAAQYLSQNYTQTSTVPYGQSNEIKESDNSFIVGAGFTVYL